MKTLEQFIFEYMKERELWITNTIDTPGWKIISERYATYMCEQQSEQHMCDMEKLRENLAENVSCAVADAENEWDATKHLEPEWLTHQNSQPWAFVHVLEKLVEGNDILLHQKDFDRHGWEEFELCFQIGKEIVQKMKYPSLSTAPTNK